jgi:hypothetical protein
VTVIAVFIVYTLTSRDITFTGTGNADPGVKNKGYDGYPKNRLTYPAHLNKDAISNADT